MPRNVTLELKCRYCGESLTDSSHLVDGSAGIKLKVQRNEQTAFVWLSALFGSNNLESEMEFKKGEVVELLCPHCSAPQTTTKKCDLCGAPLTMFIISDGGKLRICCRSGCKNLWLDL